MTEPTTRIAAFLRDVPPLFTAEKAVSFDPVQTTYLQKLVRESVLQTGVSVKKEEFFHAIVYLDYFTEVVAGRPTLMEDVHVIVEELERMHEYLDPDLELLVRYSGLHLQKDLKDETLFKPATLNQIAKRHEKANTTIDWALAEKTASDVFHQAVARMVLDQQPRAEARPCLEKFQGRADLKATLFADAIVAVLPSAEWGPAATEALQKGEVQKAAVELLTSLVKSSKGWSLKEHVERIKAGLR